MDPSSVARALNTWRARYGLTQRQIAGLAGVSEPTGNSWCRGKTEPSLGQVATLDAAYPGLVELLFPDARPFAHASNVGS